MVEGVERAYMSECTGCKYYDESTDACNADERCYMQGREDGIDKAIECALWYLWGAHIVVDQEDMERYIRKMVDFEAGERVCVTDAFPTHIGGQSPPFFTLFDRICSLFRECVSEKDDAYAPGFFRFFADFWRQIYDKSRCIKDIRGDRQKRGDFG